MRINHRITATAILAIALLLAAAGSAPLLAADSELDSRLTALAMQLEEKRHERQIPGMSIAIVKDGEVILSRGFGVTDFESNDAVTSQTLFMIGSTTKAFTATMAGMLVDEGKLAWDEPLVSYLPYFDPAVESDDPEAHITLRDALSHRSGFSRMSMLLTAQGVNSQEILEVANTAEPVAAFRKTFHYNNIMYLASGTAVAKLSDSDWHSVLRKRIFKPLGMKSSSSTAANTNRKLVPGYQWDESLAEHDRKMVLPIDAAGPAGSIVSNADDMAKWVTMLLAGGKSPNGKQLIAAETLEQTWQPNIEITDGIGYAMGWFVHEWNGHRIVDHGGNLNGFAAQVGILPDDGLGYVLLTNLTATPFQGEVGPIIWQALLGAAEPEASTADAGDKPDATEELSRLLGDYVANFGPFQDVDFAVTEKDGVLFINVPGQTNYELKPANEDGRRPFLMTDTIAVSFETANDESVNVLRMHQGGLDFELPRRGYEFPIEIDPAELLPFLGMYESDTFKREVSVILRNNRLSIDVPGELAFDLQLPDEDGRRRFRVRDVMSVTFQTDASGAVTGATLRKNDDVLETMPRTGDPDGEPLPTVDSFMALRASAARRAAWAKAGITKTTSKIKFVNAGVVGESVEWVDGKSFRSDLNFGKFGWTRTFLSEAHAMSMNHVVPEEEIKGRALKVSRDALLVNRTLDWREAFEKVQVLKREEIDGVSTVRILLQNPDLPAINVYCDPLTGDVLRLDSFFPLPGANAELPMTSRLQDYREVEGMRIPFKLAIENSETGVAELTVLSVETGISGCDSLAVLADVAPCSK